MRRLALFFTAIAFLFTARSALALAVPSKSDEFYVQDLANVIEAAAEIEFIARSQALAAQDGTQIVLLTIPSLEGDSLEEFSLKTARAWGIGGTEKDNGVLILLVMDSHDIRIEVGYGLESVLPDGLAGRLQRQYLIPRLQEGDYSGGVLALQDAIIKIITQDESFLAAMAEEENLAESVEKAAGLIFLSSFSVWIFFALIIFLILGSRRAYWRKCPRCERRQLQVRMDKVSLTEQQKVTTCKNCHYLKKGPVTMIPVITGSGFGDGFGGGFSSGSSGGGGSFGGGGSSGKW